MAIKCGFDINDPDGMYSTKEIFDVALILVLFSYRWGCMLTSSKIILCRVSKIGNTIQRVPGIRARNSTGM
jgi:hypothetical protein